MWTAWLAPKLVPPTVTLSPGEPVASLSVSVAGGTGEGEGLGETGGGVNVGQIRDGGEHSGFGGSAVAAAGVVSMSRVSAPPNQTRAAAPTSFITRTTSNRRPWYRPSRARTGKSPLRIERGPQPPPERRDLGARQQVAEAGDLKLRPFQRG